LIGDCGTQPFNEALWDYRIRRWLRVSTDLERRNDREARARIEVRDEHRRVAEPIYIRFIRRARDRVRS
jgi:hypothetical protein